MSIKKNDTWEELIEEDTGLLDSSGFLVLVVISEFIELIILAVGNIANRNTAVKLNILKTEKPESFIDRLLKTRLFLI